MSERAAPFGDLADFKPRQAAARPDAGVLDKIAENSDFPSRSARPSAPVPVTRPVRRYTTGRNRQINVKATEETITSFYALADELNQPLGAVLEMAIEALAREREGLR
jgi:hypothetical protein